MKPDTEPGDPRHTPKPKDPPTAVGPAQPGAAPPMGQESVNSTNVNYLDAKGLDDIRQLEEIRRGGATVNLPTTPIPGYDILGELGRGGMGMVYRARQRSLKRTVALKMILATGGADLDSLARFMREAETVARMQHPNILQIYEIGKHEGRLFFAMEYVDGGSLEQMINGTPQPPREAAEMVELLAKAMEYVHEQGIVHRDLKPSNILLLRTASRDNTAAVRLSRRSGLDYHAVIPKISDFGLAKSLDESERLTATGDIVGTLSYMSPEQADGQKDLIGPLSDVYALGTILYELLTGRPPFAGETPAATLLRVLEEDPVPPSRLHPRVPRDLEVICLKCLEKDQTKRYPSALALAEDLRRFINKEAIMARPIQVFERFVRWSRRNPKITVVGLLFLLMLLSGLLSGAWVFSHLAIQLRTAEERETAAVARADKLREALMQSLAAGSVLAGNEPSTAADLVRLAESCAVAASLLEENPAQADQYAGLALRLLQKAKAAGWFRDVNHVDQVRRSPKFAILSERPEFQELFPPAN